MNKFRATLPYVLVQGMFWGVFAVLVNYASNFLYHYGFSDSQISYLLGAVMIMAVGFQVGSAELISRIPKLKTHMVFLASCGVMILCALGMWFGSQWGWLSISCFAVSSLLLQSFPALANSLGMEAVEKGVPLVYGLARATGSLVNGLTAYVVGLAVGKHGISILPPATIILAAALVVGIVWFRRVTTCYETQETTAHVPKKAVKKAGFLKAYPHFAIFLVGGILLCISQTLLSNFLFQVVSSKGGDATHQGMAGGIAALVEIPVMLLFPIMVRKISSGKWVRLSSVFFLLKALSIYFATTPEMAVAAHAIQMLSYGLFAISSVNYAAEIVGEGEAVRAQSYLATNLTIGSLVALSTGGVICQYLGVPALLLISSGFAVLGGILLIVEALVNKKPHTSHV